MGTEEPDEFVSIPTLMGKLVIGVLAACGTLAVVWIGLIAKIAKLERRTK